MSRRLDVLAGIKAMVANAMPAGADVVGLDGGEAPPARIPAGGRAVIRSGSAGDPEVDLSPIVYNWSHRIPVELAFDAQDHVAAEERLDAAVTALGAAIEADRTLGGLCDWLDAMLPETENVFVEGARPPRATELILTAQYSTTSPTG